MTPVGFGDISTVWEDLQCSAREKAWTKVHPEEVGTATAYQGACPACPSLAGLQVRRYTLHIHSTWAVPWLFNIHGPSPCSSDPSNIHLDRHACEHDWMALTDYLSFPGLFSAGFEMINFSSSFPDTLLTYRLFLEVASLGHGILAKLGREWSCLGQRPGSGSWACGGTKLLSGRNSLVE